MGDQRLSAGINLILSTFRGPRDGPVTHLSRLTWLRWGGGASHRIVHRSYEGKACLIDWKRTIPLDTSGCFVRKLPYPDLPLAALRRGFASLVPIEPDSTCASSIQTHKCLPVAFRLQHTRRVRGWFSSMEPGLGHAPTQQSALLRVEDGW